MMAECLAANVTMGALAAMFHCSGGVLWWEVDTFRIEVAEHDPVDMTITLPEWFNRGGDAPDWATGWWSFEPDLEPDGRWCVRRDR